MQEDAAKKEVTAKGSPKEKRDVVELTTMSTAVASMIAAIAAAHAAYSANELSKNSLAIETSIARPIVQISELSGSLPQAGTAVVTFSLTNEGQTSAQIKTLAFRAIAVTDLSGTVMIEPAEFELVREIEKTRIVAGGQLVQTHSFPLKFKRVSARNYGSLIGEIDVQYSFDDGAETRQTYSITSDHLLLEREAP